MLYTSIIDMPMVAWHYFYKYYVLHSTLKDDKTILDKIELFKDNSENVEIGIQLKNYIASLADDKDIMPSINYFKSLHQTENFNFTDPHAWVNVIDTDFYNLCEVLQTDYSKDVKTLTILEFFSRMKYLENNNKKTIK